MSAGKPVRARAIVGRSSKLYQKMALIYRRRLRRRPNMLRMISVPKRLEKVWKPRCSRID